MNSDFPDRWVWFFLAGLCLALSPRAQAYSQELVPVIREIHASTPSISSWNAFVPVHEEGGCAYVPLAHMAALLEGTVHWRPAAHQVDLTVRGHTSRFFYDSNRMLLDGVPHPLERVTIKNNQGFWVPASFFATSAFFHVTKTKIGWPPAEVKPKPAVAPVPIATVSPAVAPHLASGHPLPEGEGTTKDVPSPSGEGARRADRTGNSAPVKPVQSLQVVGRDEGVPPAISPKAIHRIVIDPGHGGKDPGTAGSHGVEEKALNLLIAQDLADALRDQEGYEVLLTRTDDTFIPLAERTRLANKYNADLFISIHCNASLSSKLKGFEVYFLSERASDPHADAVARLENAPLALEGKDSPTPNQVQAVLRSLLKTANINEASELGALVDRHIGEQLSEPRLGVKQAAFYVLRGAEMPAILIETGFLSNPKEEKLLQKDSFRKSLIEGIVKGIKAYDERKQKERHG